jgi:hypothetical protein
LKKPPSQAGGFSLFQHLQISLEERMPIAYLVRGGVSHPPHNRFTSLKNPASKGFPPFCSTPRFYSFFTTTS